MKARMNVVGNRLYHELQEQLGLDIQWTGSLVVATDADEEAALHELLARGQANEEIAKTLFISERTARTHVSNILRKLHLANRTQAALYAVREGLVNLENEQK